MNLFPKQLTITLLAPLILLVSSCSSKLISAPGIKGRFIEESTGKPIAGAKVDYTNVADGLSKQGTTDAEGYFLFEPEFTYGYAGYPTSPLALHVRLELLIRDKHNWSDSRFYVTNTDTNNAVIAAGDLKVNEVFLRP
jgi:hypothetical protein